MSLKIYNTLTKKTEDFKPIEPGVVKMYVCGPTVYDYLHIGNFRGAIFFNLVRNWLEKKGYEVRFVYNYTDVDDKIIKRAAEEGMSAAELSKKYILEFEKDYSALGLGKHTANPKVTDHMAPIIETIRTLIDRGKAYVNGGEVVYAIDSFETYGSLSGKKTDELIAGSRVEVDETKKNPLDFVLWKPAKEGEPAWDSPWGPGRPGWHIECTAMIHHLLGEEIDIHGGGIDLIFPHHENEIAQGSGASAKSYVHYWMHNNFVSFGDEKMSKSIGNIIKARDFMTEWHPEILKFMMLSAHYRSQLQFTGPQIYRGAAALARIYNALAHADQISAPGEPSKEFKTLLRDADSRIEKALDDDFNTPAAYAVFFDVVRAFNALLKPGQKISAELKASARIFHEWILSWGKMFALFQQTPSQFLAALDDILLREKKLDRTEIEGKVKSRNDARAAKDYARADAIRNELLAIGIEILDGPAGTTWTVRKSDDE